MNELTQHQVAILECLISNGFSIVAFPLYANAVGVRRENCAALLEPVVGGDFRLFGEPCVLLEGNLTVRIKDAGKTWFVWKKKKIEATPERLSELNSFVSELKGLLESHP